MNNRNDGAVEAVFEGPPAAVDALTDWCRHGPPRARVDRLDLTDELPQGLVAFRITGWD